VAASTPAEIAQAEYEEVLALTPNPANGHKAYITCAVCHRPEGWGTLDGTYPQIAGQHQDRHHQAVGRHPGAQPR
jgi:cytochrome c553